MKNARMIALCPNSSLNVRGWTSSNHSSFRVQDFPLVKAKYTSNPQADVMIALTRTSRKPLGRTNEKRTFLFLWGLEALNIAQRGQSIFPYQMLKELHRTQPSLLSLSKVVIRRNSLSRGEVRKGEARAELGKLNSKSSKKLNGHTRTQSSHKYPTLSICTMHTALEDSTWSLRITFEEWGVKHLCRTHRTQSRACIMPHLSMQIVNYTSKAQSTRNWSHKQTHVRSKKARPNTAHNQSTFMSNQGPCAQGPALP